MAKMKQKSRLVRIFDSSTMHILLGSLILLNMTTLGMATSASWMDAFGPAIIQTNTIILGVFTIEIMGRMVAHGGSFFRDPWHVFDFLVVSIALLTFGSFFQIFRVIRILWLLRMLSIAPQFRHMINAILKSIPGLSVVFILLLGAIYVFGIIGTQEYRYTNPENFGDLLTSMGTLGKTLLMPMSWRPLLASLEQSHAYAWIYVAASLLILTYLLMHLVIGVVLSAVQHQYLKEKERFKKGVLGRIIHPELTKEHKEHFSAETQMILHEIHKLKEKISHLPSSKKISSPSPKRARTQKKAP